MDFRALIEAIQSKIGIGTSRPTTPGHVLTVVEPGKTAWQPGGGGGGGGGGTPSDSVVSQTAFGQAPAVGVATTYSRGDHTHGTPSDPVPAHAALIDVHHARTHAHDGVDGSGSVAHTSLINVTPDQHHVRQHSVLSLADHTLVGATMQLVGLPSIDTLGLLTPSAAPGTAAAILRTSDAGKLTLAELGVAAVDSDLLPKTTDTYDLGSSLKLWRKGWLSEMQSLLFAENTIGLIGGWFYVTHDQGTLNADVAPADTSIDFGRTMTTNHFVVMRSALQVEYVQVGTLVSGTRFNVTRNLDGTGADAWPKGTPFAVLGTTGHGRIELNAHSTPRISLIEQGAAYNAQTERVRIGDMANWLGLGLTGWGWGAGDSTRHAYYTPGSGLVVRGTIQADAGHLGDLAITGVLGIGTSGGIYQGTGSFASPTTGLKIHNSGGVGLLEMWGSGTKQAYVGTDGKLYAGEGRVVLGAAGLTLSALPTQENRAMLRFVDGATTLGWMYGLVSDPYYTTIIAAQRYGVGGQGAIRLEAWAGSNATNLHIDNEVGVRVTGTGGAGATFSIGNGGTLANLFLRGRTATGWNHAVMSWGNNIDNKYWEIAHRGPADTTYDGSLLWQWYNGFSWAYRLVLDTTGRLVLFSALDLPEIAAPSSPPSGWGRLYFHNTRSWPMFLNDRTGAVPIPLGRADVDLQPTDFYSTTAELIADENWVVRSFDSTALRWMDASIPLPADWGGRSLTITVWWAPGNNNSGNIQWNFEIRRGRLSAYKDGGAYGGTYRTVSPVPSNEYRFTHQSVSPAMWVDPATAGGTLGVRVFRRPSDTEDTYTGTVFVLAVKISIF